MDKEKIKLMFVKYLNEFTNEISDKSANVVADRYADDILEMSAVHGWCVEPKEEEDE